jgi:MAF protein
MRDKLNKYFSTFILASASPARKQILVNEGLNVIIRPTDSDESLTDLDELSIENKIETLARRKLSSYAEQYGLSDDPVLCCDTLVYFNEELVGKAKNKDDARATLLSFSAKEQKIYTGYSLYIPKKGIFCGCDEASAIFNTLDNEIVDEYINCDEWIGAAGSYRIQGKGSSLINHTLGDFNTIVGLPLLIISDLIRLTLT